MGSKFFTLGALALSAAFVSQHAAAQSTGTFPNRPIRMIVPAAPGGGTDFSARTLAQPLSESLGQSVVVDNRPGASGNIGVELAAKSTPDGYTIVMPITSFAMNPHLFKKLPFDTLNDLAPITLASIAPLYLVVTPTLPATSVNELIALAKAKPGQLSYANSGNGTSAHLAGELFKKMAGVDLVSIPYRGGGPAVLDLIGGRVQVYFATIPAALNQVRAGKLRGLAVTSAKRVDLMPEVPTIAESGLPGYEIVGWFGLFAPAGTPAPVIAKLEKEFNNVLRLPDTQKRFASQGLVPGGGTSEELGRFLRAEIKKWGALIRDIGLEAQ